MLHADVVKGTHDRTLEETPYTLDGVRVNVSTDPFPLVADDLVAGILVTNSDVGAEVVGVDRVGLVLDVLTDESFEGFALEVGDPPESDLSAPLDCTGDVKLGGTLASVPELPAAWVIHPCLIDLDHPEESQAHKTEAVYRRYAIADAAALAEGVQKLARLHQQQEAEPVKVVSIVR